VRGNATNLQQALATNGWPTVNSVRGMVLFMLNGPQPNYILPPHAELAGRVAFIGYDLANANGTDAAILLLDDPQNSGLDNGTTINDYARMNVIVRTKSDLLYVPGGSDRSVTDDEVLYFNLVDVDHNGAVDPTEIKAFANAFGVGSYITDAKITQLFGACGATTSLNQAQFDCVVNVAETFGHVNLIAVIPSLASTILRSQVANASGAHVIATNYPVPPYVGASAETDFWMQVPGGTPYRCNPITSNAGCTPDAIENLHPIATTGVATTGVATTGVATTGRATSATSTSGQTSSNSSGKLNSSAVSIQQSIVVVIVAIIAALTL